MTYSIDIQGNTKKVVLTCLIPKDISNVQQVLSIQYSSPPRNVYSVDGNKYAEFLIESTKGEMELTVTTQLELFKHDLKSVLKDKRVFLDSPDRYLQAEKNLEANDSLLHQTGMTLWNADTLHAMRNIYDFVRGRMVYSGYDPGQKGALRALHERTGDCTEFSDLFVALCRTCGIPAMAVEGLTTNQANTPKHNWAAAFYSKYGWIRFDPTTDVLNSFKDLTNRYVQLSSERNDKTLKNGHFYSYTYWGDPIILVEDIKIKELN